MVVGMNINLPDSHEESFGCDFCLPHSFAKLELVWSDRNLKTPKKSIFFFLCPSPFSVGGLKCDPCFKSCEQ